MKIAIEDYDLHQSLSSIIGQASITGNLSISLYPDEQNWMNANEALPYVYRNGKIEWNVPIQQVTLKDIAKTFQMNAGCTHEFEIVESQFWTSGETDLQLLTRCFMKFWKKTMKNWGPERIHVSSKVLEKFLLHTGVLPVSVFHAIWIRDFYELDEFSKMFSVSKKQGKIILTASGYQKKTCDTYYMRQNSRMREIEKCIEKSNEAATKLGPLVCFNNRLKNNIAMRAVQSADRKKERAMRFAYMSNPMACCDEPAYGKREERIEHLLIAVISIVMVIFVVAICVMFIWQLNHTYSEQLGSIFGFWGSILGALIAGVVTIFTTYFIIRRSYKVDYHTERIMAMPFFNIVEEFHDISIDRNEMPKKVKKFWSSHICDCVGGDLGTRYNLLKIKNQGRGPAFRMEISGAWPDYENYGWRSMAVDETYYIAVPNYSNEKIKLTYYDLYGNYYFQLFVIHENEDRTCMRFEGDPPELIIRTNRIRYTQ